MRFILVLSVLVLVGLIFGCSDKPTTPTATAPETPEITTPRTIQQLAQEEPDLFRAVNSFSFALFTKIVEGAGSRENVFLSPLSVAYAVAICYNGAAGETKTGIAKALQLEGYTDDQINRFFRDLMADLPLVDSTALLEIANSAWHTNVLTLRTEFTDLAQSYFGAEVRGLDFLSDGSADTINAWVDSTTHGCIKDIVSANQLKEMVAVILNAIYFKGNWTTAFVADSTKERSFFFEDGSEQDRLLMMTEDRFEYLRTDLMRGVNLPYGNKSFAMIVLVPSPPHTVGELVAELSIDRWEQWLGELSEVDSVRVWLPRLKLENTYPLNQVLCAMGMGIAFTELADFSKMVDGGGIMISEVKQKTFLRVDETGTEAAAITEVGMIPTSLEGPPGVVANRPFLLAICERTTGAILFLGRIGDPEW